jgi:hypothetical protein
MLAKKERRHLLRDDANSKRDNNTFNNADTIRRIIIERLLALENRLGREQGSHQGDGLLNTAMKN